MPPITFTRSHTEHYSPYNLPSRGSPQKSKVHSAPPSLSRPLDHCRASANYSPLPGDHVISEDVQPFAVIEANYVPFEVTTEYYPQFDSDVRRAIQDGVPPQVVGFGIKYKFAMDCTAMAQTLHEEQRKLLVDRIRAMEANEPVPQERIKVMFFRGKPNHVEDCVTFLRAILDSMLPADPATGTVEIREATVNEDVLSMDITDANVEEVDK
ncbi:hypothetical protein V8B97DRAFT_2013895 [Scleroderma yunnanense]